MYFVGTPLTYPQDALLFLGMLVSFPHLQWQKPRGTSQFGSPQMHRAKLFSWGGIVVPPNDEA
jgi:hypothetical protein